MSHYSENWTVLFPHQEVVFIPLPGIPEQPAVAMKLVLFRVNFV